MTSWRCEISQVTYFADTLVPDKDDSFRVHKTLDIFCEILHVGCNQETELGDWSSEKEQWCFREVQPTVTTNRVSGVTTGEFLTLGSETAAGRL